ncbi:hypothetical protein LWI29_022042 [Acer saccharum]|uniref:Uncharacterized protein n=1 Tax=Acer saccharum TaxID=4024 RepID=A0AA39REU6_ACESA|nr:hypothetical protein LWI29_022042 [Acer saccharum]
MVAAQVCQSQQVGRSEDSLIGVHVHSSRVGAMPVSSEGPSSILDVSAGAVVSISSAVSMVGQGSKVGRDSVSPLVSFAQPIVSSVVSIDELDDRDPTTPPPTIGKIGPYTVFVTPPSTPKPAEPPVIESPQKVVAPPVQPPPQQFEKPVSVQSLPDGSVSGFFKNAVNKVQNAHSSLDDHLARWFGLNQSKYQWALDDYYENKGLEKEVVKAKEMSSKVQSV